RDVRGRGVRGDIMNRHPRGRWWIATSALLSCVLALLVGGLAPDRTARLGEARADSPAPAGTSLDIGLTGTATASSEATGAPASNAIDGSASTSWCST